jgi:hypothetical protein
MAAALHAVLFALGVVALLLGVSLGLPALLLIAGPCLAASGLLLWIGVRITLAGPFGDALRVALGRGRSLSLHLRALLWLCIGIAVTAYGIRGIREGGAPPPWHREPLAPAADARVYEKLPLAVERVRGHENALAALAER